MGKFSENIGRDDFKQFYRMQNFGGITGNRMSYSQMAMMNYGTCDIGNLLVSGVVGLATMGIQKLDRVHETEGRGGGVSSKKAGKEKEKEIAQLNQDLTKALGGYSSVEAFKSAVNDKEEKELKPLQDELRGIDVSALKTESTNLKDTTIPNLKKEIAALKDNDPNKATKEQALKEAEARAAEIDKQLKRADELKSQIAKKTDEISQLQTQLGEAENIQDRIKQLKGEETDENKDYNFEQEIKDIKTFGEALREFAQKPVKTKEEAQALKKSFEDNNIDNPTVRKAYEMITKLYPELFK